MPPRFFKRIFTDNPFRREQAPPDNLQRTRRVLVRNSTGPLTHSAHQLSYFEMALHMEGTVALRSGASIASSSRHAIDRPILAPSLADHEAAPKTSRVRRRLNKKHRKST
jgi:hypothetical protein